MHAQRLLATLLLVVPAAAQAGRRTAPEDLLPSTTWFHARLAGLGGGREALEKSGVFQLMTREETKELTDRGMKEVEPYVEQALDRLRSGLQRVGVAPDALRALLHGPVAVGLGRLTLVGHIPMPSALLVIDVAGREAQARDAFTQFWQAAEKLVPGHKLLVQKETFQGVEIQHSGPEQLEHCVAHAWVDGFLLVGLNDFYLKEAITARKAGTTLAAHPALARNRARLPGDPVLALNLDLSFFLSWLERFLPYEAQDLGRAFGIEGLNGLYVATGPAGRGDMTVVQLDIPGSEQGLLKALTSRPVSYKAAAWLPAETGMFVSTSLDAKALATAVTQALAKLPPAVRRHLEQGFHHGLMQGLGNQLEVAGLDLHALHECLACLGSELTLAANVPPKGGFVPEAVLFADVQDGKQAEQLLVGLLDKLLPGAHQTMAFKEHTIHWLEVPDAQVKLSPCFVVTDGMVIASINPQTLKKTLGRGSRKDGSLAADPRFAALVQETGRTSLFVDLRVPTAVRWAHGMAQPFLDQFLKQHEELGIDAATVPTPEVLEQALEDLVVSLNVDQHGVTVTARSSTGFGSLLAGAMATGDWLLEKLGKGRIY